MDVPSVVEADITRYHKWQSSDGNEIEAMYVDAKDSGVTLLMKRNPNKPCNWVGNGSVLSLRL